MYSIKLSQYKKIISYILVNETGHSLKVLGWQERDEITPGRQWKHTDGNPRQTDQPTCDKRQFFKTLALPNKHLHRGNGMLSPKRRVASPTA